ncbi:MAG: rhomboid family intramembrane serine protease [Candidatus Woesearchaeota archaeon]|jgi:rhomboid protease GluP|nr:rhomboid family intramembrane serine protease [Candidatus Woesearchaeota archaeon]
MSSKELDTLISNLHLAQENENKSHEVTALLKLSEYHYNLNNFEKAKLLLKQILTIDSKVFNVNYYLALIEVHEENYDLATSYLVKELKINSKNMFAIQLKDKLKINSNFPLVTFFLFFLNVLVFFFTYPRISVVNAIKFGLSDFNFGLSNAVTSLFFHINIYHFLINVVILLMFGLILEKKIGSFKFLVVYLLSGILGNYAQVFLFEGTLILGASAALFGMLGALMMRSPLLDIRVFGFLKVPLIVLLGSFFTFSSLIGVYLNLDFVSGDVAHFIGLLIGIVVIGFFYIDSIFIFYNWLFISLGFWIITFALRSVLLLEVLDFKFLVLAFISFLIGIVVIVYAYFGLKEALIVRGVYDEAKL